MFPSRVLKAAADSYKATDFTNPKYNYFFRELTARVQGILLTGGSLYGTWLVVLGPEPQR